MQNGLLFKAQSHASRRAIACMLLSLGAGAGSCTTKRCNSELTTPDLSASRSSSGGGALGAPTTPRCVGVGKGAGVRCGLRVSRLWWRAGQGKGRVTAARHCASNKCWGRGAPNVGQNTETNASSASIDHVSVCRHTSPVSGSSSYLRKTQSAEHFDWPCPCNRIPRNLSRAG